MAYVGDSRVFIIRNNTIGKITIPNTKTILMENLEFRIRKIDLKHNDFILLCTDWITSVLSESEILKVFIYKNPKEIVNELIKRA